MTKEHYLKKELYELVENDQTIFEFIQDGSLDGVWYWDLEQPKNEWMSPKFWQILGYEPNKQEHLASAWQEIIYPEDLELATQNLKKHLNNKDFAYDQVVRYKHKQGHCVWIRCRGIAIRDSSGKPIRMLGAHNEITMQKRLEQQSLEKSNALKAILDSSFDGIMALESVVDNQGEIVDFIFTMSNQMASKIVHIEEEKLLGQKLSIMMPGNFVPLDSLKGQTLFENYKEVVQSGTPKCLEFYFEHDGVKEWFENKSVKHGNGFVVTFSVITQRKELQLKLEQRVQEEVEKNRKNQQILFEQSRLAEMGLMLHMIAHQWRQPLNNLSLLFNNFIVKFKKNRLTAQNANELNGDFQTQIAYMSKTIDDFGNFFKPIHHKTVFNFKNIIEETLGLVKPILKKNKIIVNLQCDEKEEYFGYKNELQQVILNIIINAQDSLIESLKNDKQISIQLQRTKNALILLIEDNGLGFTLELSTVIFNPYFSTKTSKNGTGLGLYMAKTIIEEHFCGSLEATPLQVGARFSIELPIG